MYEVLKPIYPAGPCNRTDPIVRHDGEATGSSVAKFYTPQSDPQFSRENPSVKYDATAVDGIQVPVIKVNNRVIESSSISYFKLSSTNMFPSVDLVIVDTNDMIHFSDVPGFNNVITVVMLCPVASIYKKVSIDFYITSCNFCGGIVTYHGEYKLLALEAIQFKQLTFHTTVPGCQAKWCQLGPDEKPTTYEFLHCIAHDCGLGFAATQQCKEVADHNYRLLSSQKYKDAILKHVSFGGIDENSIFDAWIDIFGYLVMVNVPWIFNEAVAPDELASQAVIGIEGTDSGIKDTTNKHAGLVHRMITNYTGMAQNNMTISKWTNIVDTETNWQNGTITTFNSITPIGNGGNNSIDTLEIQQQEMSVDGQDTTKYCFPRTRFIGFEMSPDTPTIKQKEIRTKYLDRLRSRMLRVEMAMPNYGLERGMLLYVMIYEFDQDKKRKIMANLQNLSGDTSDIEAPEVQANKEMYLDGTMMLDFAISGTYYIDGEEFIYDKDGSQHITQVLYLIKKGNTTNWDNFTTPTKVRDVGPKI